MLPRRPLDGRERPEPPTLPGEDDVWRPSEPALRTLRTLHAVLRREDILLVKLGRKPLLLVAALVALVAVGSAGLLLLSRRGDAGRIRHPADPGQGEERIQSLASLDVMRTGTVRLRIVEPGPEDDTARLDYRFSSPASPVADADIRGYLDGETKYLFNQGTSYHMRVGRRYNGGFHGELELKRSLVRWHMELPRLDRVDVAEARIRLWAERHHTNSPLASPDAPTLHLYAYPADQDWDAGRGGIGNDDFSAPADGEVSWEALRTGEKAWSRPGGGLSRAATDGPDAPSALAYTPITAVDTFVTLVGGPLRERIGELYSEGADELGVLLKLDDVEEDLRGTEMSLLSSNFGSDADLLQRRPTLEVALRVPGRITERGWDFVLEPGASVTFPRLEAAAAQVLLDAEVTGETGAPPVLWIRGGRDGGEEGDLAWTPLGDNPVVRSGWDWLQVKATAAPHLVTFGDPFDVSIRATWLSPGPRDAQSPELALIAPSGTVHRVRGRGVDVSGYIMEFTPRELGLWRYGWSFRPSPVYPLGAHEGEGLFFVRPPDDAAVSLARLRDFSGYLMENADSVRANREGYQTQFNNFVRWAADLEHTGSPRDSATAARLLRKVRLRIGPRRYEERP